MAYSKEKSEQIFNMVRDIGVDAAAKKLGITRESVRRGARAHKKQASKSEPMFNDNVMRQIRERFSDKELRQMASGSMAKVDTMTARHSFEGDEINFGLITDTHLGSKYTKVSRLYSAFDKCDELGVDFIAHCGDVHEGLSHRPDHMYQCTHLGYEAQLAHSREVFSQWTNSPIYMIDGNHDRWFIKSAGAYIVKELCSTQDNLKFIGHDEGDIKLKGCPVTIKLWHGEDGSSYAYSYRVQKLVESFTGGEKPNVLLTGHTHKAFYLPNCRHVECVSAGAIQSQSAWMRSKKHANHTGFWTVKMLVDKKGVVSFTPTWYPFYE